MKVSRTLKVAPWLVMSKVMLFICIFLGQANWAIGQQSSEVDPLLLPAPPELMAKLKQNPPPPAKVENVQPVPPAKEKAAEEEVVREIDLKAQRVQRMEALIAKNEQILNDPGASAEAKQRARRELPLQRLKLKKRAAE